MRGPMSKLAGLFAEVGARLSRTARAESRTLPAPGANDWGYAPYQWEGYPDTKLPPGCPVIALGVNGEVSYFVDTLGQIIPSPAGSRTDDRLFDLFKGASNYVHHHWPARDRKGEPNYDNVEKRKAWNCLINAAARKGLFDPATRVRGRGGWPWGRKNEVFLWHAGARIYTSHEGRFVEAEPGEIDGKFYPAGPEMPEPWNAAVPIEDSPGPAILRHLQSWRYRRQQLDPVLLTGAIACAFYGGALEQRPVTLLVGDRGQGKSSLQKFFKELMGDFLLDTANTTAAGIYQKVRSDSLAVWVDEFEGSAHGNARAQAIIDLARQAYSGSIAMRGGSDHNGTQFQLSSSFFFSAIAPPPMEAADYSRMAVVSLLRLAPGSEEPDFPLDVGVASRMLLRRLIDQWPAFRGYLEQWRRAFRKSGLDSRFCDTFGHFLAGAHVLLGDEGMEEAGIPVTASEEAIGAWVTEATAYERGLIVDNWRACLEHLLGTTITAWHEGAKPTVGDVLRRYATTGIEDGLDIKPARQRLGVAGLGLVDLADDRAKGARGALRARESWMALHGEDRRPYLLVVPNKGPALAQIYTNTRWAGGGWRMALQQAPPHIAISGEGIPEMAKINGAVERCTCIDVVAYLAEAKAGEALEG